MKTGQISPEPRRRIPMIHLTLVVGSGLLAGSLATWGGYTTTPYGLLPALCLGVFSGLMGMIAAHLLTLAVLQFAGLMIFLRHQRKRR